MPTDGACVNDCDPWVQDCCHGDKCVPWSSDGDAYYDSLKCAPAARAPVPVGGPCMSQGVGAGIDDCEVGAICWDVDPETALGTCVAQCKGSPDLPDCSAQPGTVCVIGFDGVVNLCLPACDPLLQDCPIGQTCLQDSFGFECAPDLSGEQGGPFTPCVDGQACDPGLVCLVAGAASECEQDAAGCCLPFCDLEEPACPGAGQQCVPWYEPGEAPAGYEDVGACALP